MNARTLTQALISAAVGSMAALAFTGSPLWAQKPDATIPPANSTPENLTNQHQQHQQHQQMIGQMQQMMEKCKSKMSQGMMGNGNGHTGGQQDQHRHGGTNPSTNQ